jgi:hypothetical protein
LNVGVITSYKIHFFFHLRYLINKTVNWITEWPTCKEDEWQCENKQCIPIESRCDVREDCTDKSDELECGIYIYK